MKQPVDNETCKNLTVNTHTRLCYDYVMIVKWWYDGNVLRLTFVVNYAPGMFQRKIYIENI